jgi:hypothetical protein
MLRTRSDKLDMLRTRSDNGGVALGVKSEDVVFLCQVECVAYRDQAQKKSKI